MSDTPTTPRVATKRGDVFEIDLSGSRAVYVVLAFRRDCSIEALRIFPDSMRVAKKPTKVPRSAAAPPAQARQRARAHRVLPRSRGEWWRAMNHLLAIDHDAHACAVYRANMPGVEVVCGDVDAALVAKYRGMLDVLCGGPPCQGFSTAGKGLGEDDERDGVPAAIECVAASMPRHFVFENVTGLLAEKHIGYFGRVIAALEKLGYKVEYQVLDAFRFGVPQFRNRVWTWGIRRDLYAKGMRHRWPATTHATPDELGVFSGGLKPWVTVREALNLDAASARGIEYRWSDDMRDKHPPAIPDEPCPTVLGKWYKGGAEGLIVIGGGRNHPADADYRRDKRDITDEPSTTITDLNGATTPSLSIRRPRGFEIVRRLTPDECVRLQSCPVDWVWPEGVSKTARYRIVGNGWACGMAAAIARSLRAVDPDARTVVDIFSGGGLGAVGWCGRYWAREERPHVPIYRVTAGNLREHAVEVAPENHRAMLEVVGVKDDERDGGLD